MQSTVRCSRLASRATWSLRSQDARSLGGGPVVWTRRFRTARDDVPRLRATAAHEADAGDVRASEAQIAAGRPGTLQGGVDRHSPAEPRLR